MKFDQFLSEHCGAVYGFKEMRFSATKEETDELRQALAVVDRWKKAAFKAAKYDPKTADWNMVAYAVKTDAVIIKVEEGACG